MICTTPESMAARFTERSLIQLTDAIEWDAAAKAIVAEKIAAVGVVIEGYIGRRYKAVADLAIVPPLLEKVAGDMAYYDLHTDPPKKVADDYRQAMRHLEAIRDGKVTIDQGEPAAIEARPGAVLISDPGRVFSREKMAGF